VRGHSEELAARGDALRDERKGEAAIRAAQDRRHSLGGSDVAAALGLDPRKTALDLWKEKLLGADHVDTPATRRGKFLEPAILRRHLAGVDAAQIVPQAAFTRDGWRSVHLDAFARGRNIEVKTVTRRVFEADWGPAGTDDVPERTLCQVLWGADLSEAEGSEAIAAVLPEDPDEVLGLSADEVAAVCEIHVYPIARNPAVEAAIVERAFKFWHINVQQQIAPERVDLEDAKKLWRAEIAGRFVEATEADVALVLERDRLKAAGKANSAALERIEFALAERIGDAEGLRVERVGPILTWKKTKRGAYTVAETAFRQFRTTKWWTKLTEDRA
jgi:hypothetical protein